jgi:serine/threonine-protein kinase
VTDDAESPDLTRLTAPGIAPAESLSLFRALRSTPDEPRAIDAVRAAAATRPIFEPLRVAVGAALVDRGERDAALAWLEARRDAVSPEARILAADLRAERGELSLALAQVERVLLVDLDHPGARERHRRLRALLGLGLDAPRGPRIDADVATVVTREPDAPFVLLREIARGGAGAVYEAEDRELRRRVALKVYHHPDRPSDRAQLLHEARVAASLAGAGVVRVFDVDPTHAWLALEWAPLGSLRQRLRAGDARALVPIEAWLVPLASALARVHGARWVHHDVKPANVLFAAPDRPLLADFGSARRAGEPSPPGSLGYVSPERLDGRASDPRDDVFGLGRVLEDVLDALHEVADPAISARWRPLATACTGPDAARPSDARAVLVRLRVEAAPATG